MEQKRVSFKVAKAIKKAGYPQEAIETVFATETFLHNGCSFEAGCSITHPFGIPHKYLASIPTYLEVWLWLWREKKIQIDIELISSNLVGNFVLGQRVFTNGCYQIDPEESIIAAIDYLVDNDLIKNK